MQKSGSMTIKNGSIGLLRETPETESEFSFHLPHNSENLRHTQQNYAEQNVSQPNVEFKQTLFNFREIEERKEIHEIKEVIEAIKQEIKAIKQSGDAFAQELNDVDNLIINEKSEKSNIYTMRFLEVVLNLLRTIRMKVGESRTWLDALVSKKAKRGSAFAARSKKHGTQYSMSEEMKVTRSTQ